MLAVGATLAVRGVREFGAWLASRPGTTCASSGVGSPTHPAAARLVETLRIDAVHVPYNGSSLAFADLVAGRIDLMMTTPNSAVGMHPSVRAAAATMLARSRLPGLDRLPSIAETLVPGYDFGLRHAVFAPAGTPEATFDALNARFRDVLAREPVRAALADGGVGTVGGSAAGAAAVCGADVARMRGRASR